MIAFATQRHSTQMPMPRPRSRSGNISERMTHTGMFRAVCMQNTNSTMNVRMTNALGRPSGSNSADNTMSACAVVVATNPPMIRVRRGTRSMRKNRQIADPTTASTPLATFAINAPLAENPAWVNTCVP